MVTRKTPAKKAPAASGRRPAGKRPAAKQAVEREASKSAAAAPRPAKKAASEPVAKPARQPRKLKLVRDSFTMPEADFELVATLKRRAMSAGREAKKSELLRAGLHALAGLEAAALASALEALQPVKVGRPKKGH